MHPLNERLSPLNKWLSPHFTVRELVRSQVADRLGIDNTPPPCSIRRMRALCVNVLEPVRLTWGPFSPNSGWRSRELNTALKGADNSQHTKGEAADFEIIGVSNLQLARWVRRHVSFDQLILEYYVEGDPNSGWLHVSWRRRHKRSEVLTAVRRKGFMYGLPTEDGSPREYA